MIKFIVTYYVFIEDILKLCIKIYSNLCCRCALVHAARSGHFEVVTHLVACDWTPDHSRNDIDSADAVQQALVAASAQSHLQVSSGS